MLFILGAELFIADNSSSEDILLKLDRSSLSLAIGSTAMLSSESDSNFSSVSFAITVEQLFFF